MKRRIIIGSVLVLTLLLSMPSIQAIRHTSINHSYSNEINDSVKFPSLLEIINNWLYIRYFRAWILILLATPPPYIDTIYPLMDERGEKLYVRTDYLSDLFQNISDILGFGWEVYKFYE